MDINAAIAAFSHAGGNLIGPLKLYAGDSLVAVAKAAEISGTQEDIMGLIRSRSGESGLTRAQIEEVGQCYLAASRPDVNEIGLRSLLQYVIWVAWHDGWLAATG